ncbi:hypothetical protein Tco_0549545 [Tanacetum coccineum]
MLILILDRFLSLSKIMIIDYKLTYPSGTATTVLYQWFPHSKRRQDGQEASSEVCKVLYKKFCVGLFLIACLLKVTWVQNLSDFDKESKAAQSYDSVALNIGDRLPPQTSSEHHVLCLGDRICVLEAKFVYGVLGFKQN